MPRLYRQRMVAMQFFNTQDEHKLEYDEELLKKMSKDEVKRLKAARASFK